MALVMASLLVATLACRSTNSPVDPATPPPAVATPVPVATAPPTAAPSIVAAVPCQSDCGAPLRTQGMELVDRDGNRVQLRGVNLGGWLHWEGWIWGDGFTGETAMLERLADLAGEAQVRSFRRQVLDTFITEADIARIAALGFNVVRVPVNHRLLADDTDPYADPAAGWARLDRLFEWCGRHGVYVVLTLHAAPGGQAKLFTADPDGVMLWESAGHQAGTVELWRAIAGRYRDEPWFAAYDLLNEPDPPEPETLLALYGEIIAAIRAVDAERIIMLEGADYGRDLSIFPGPLTSNQAYSFHMYTWFGDNRRELLDDYLTVARRDNVPLWVGEFGENELAMIESTVALYEEPAHQLAGWAFWTWKKAPNRYPYLVGIQPSAAWEPVIGWIEWPGWPNPQPDAAQVEAGMQEFLAALRPENQVENAELIQVLTQSVVPVQP